MPGAVLLTTEPEAQPEETPADDDEETELIETAQRLLDRWSTR